MQEGDNPEDFQQACDMGQRRFTSLPRYDSPVLIPTVPHWAGDRREFVKRQLKGVRDVEDLLVHYSELLIRAKSLADFCQNNIGADEEWPITLYGDSEEVEACFYRRVNSLAVACHFLDECAADGP